jgi:class 3 adenylate cyclase
MKEFLQCLADGAKDIFDHDIESSKTFHVPGRDDPGLTFGRNQVKRGKLIETCVLFIDIRNSTAMSRSLKRDKAKLGKIYSAFVDAMVSIADRYGYVRNIIGDRVMVVFEPENCFIDAVNCAAMMYTVGTRILKKYSGLETFKCGIGIEYGEMLILKTGIQKRHEEQSEYKNLVWVGDAANVASKLTDLSSKEYCSPLYKVTYIEWDYDNVLNGYEKSISLADKYLYGGTGKPIYRRELVQKNRTTSLSIEEFANKVEITAEGWKYDGKKITGIEKENRSGYTSPILMSGKVYSEFKKADPKSPHLKNFSQKNYPHALYVNTGIYGGNAICSEITQIQI